VQQLETLRAVPRAARERVAYALEAYDRRRAVQDVLGFYGHVMTQKETGRVAQPSAAGSSAVHA
jgi:hypothetical protein